MEKTKPRKKRKFVKQGFKFYELLSEETIKLLNKKGK